VPSVTAADGPVAVTGASGYIGSHVVIALMKRGYNIRACVTDQSRPEKTDHLLKLNNGVYPGRLELVTANLLVEGSYDDAFAGCSAVMHVGTAMGYGNANSPRQVYDGAVIGTTNVLNSVKKAGTVKRVVYTSSFAAIAHPAPQGYVFSEKDWATDNRASDPTWVPESIDKKGGIAYAMAKAETEHMAARVAAEDGRFDVISVCPLIGLGPLLSRAHELVWSWQWHLGRMLAGHPCGRGWRHLWNIVDVRDVGEVQALIIESDRCRNGARYQLAATDPSGELNVIELKAHLARLFPHIAVGGPPKEYDGLIRKYGKPFDSPRAYSDLARHELGLKTHAIDDTLFETGRTMIELELVKPAFK
jgi:bifunctional dihydroflavonol 4-reductase/flavanone 4-reductase